MKPGDVTDNGLLIVRRFCEMPCRWELRCLSCGEEFAVGEKGVEKAICRVCGDRRGPELDPPVLTIDADGYDTPDNL